MSENKTREDIISEHSPHGEYNHYYHEHAILEMLTEFSDQEKRSTVSAFLLWLDLSDWVFMAGTKEFENVRSGEIKPYDFVYDLYLQSLPKKV